MNNARLSNPSNVGGASGVENVKNLWLHHYQSLHNFIPGSPANIKKINEYCSNVQFNVQMIVNVKEIQDIMHAMPIGKAPGYDSVSNEHFKYANEKLLYSSMLIHGFLPDAMMITIIAPIIKNKAGDLFDNNNYRPTALATIASKLFESLILIQGFYFFIYMCKPIWI